MPEIEMPNEQPVVLNWFQLHQKAIWIALIAVAVVVAGTLTYLLFFREQNPPVYQGDAKLTLLVPTEAASGAELSIRAKIENLSNTKLNELNLELFYPQGFTFLNATPDPKDDIGRTFALPDLAPNAKAEIVIIGHIDGSLQEIKTVSAKLHYVPENFRSTFVAESSAVVEIMAADITMEIFAPTRLISGQTAFYRLELHNVSTKSFANLRVKFRYPDKFDGDPQEQDVGLLPAGESKTVEVKGKLSADAGTEALVEAELIMPSDTGQQISIGRSFAFTQMDSSPLALSHITTGCNASNCSILAIPDQAQYKVQYQNQGQVALNNVTIAVVFDTPIFDSLEVSGNKGQILNNSLVWTPRANSELLVVAPGQKGEFIFQVKIPELLTQKLLKNPSLVTRVEYYADEVPTPIVGNTLTFSIGTELTLTATAAPQGNNVYLIQLSLANTVNDVEDAEFTATIPGVAGSFDLGSLLPPAEAGSVQFNQSSGVLRWRLGEIFAFAGSFHEARTLSFRVTSPDQNLLRDLQVTGRDQFTGRQIQSNKIPVLGTGSF